MAGASLREGRLRSAAAAATEAARDPNAPAAMSTCCWCTIDDSSRTSLLKNYATGSLSAEELASANEDLCYCLECVDGYHKARDEVPSLHKELWELETTRLIFHFEKTMAGGGEEDDLYIVEEDGEMFPCYTSPLSMEKHLRVPLLEILKYPYLLLHKLLSEHCVLALCEMEKNNYSYQVMDKYPGIYLLMVHPNEMICRWAILTARSLGKVDRDDYYDIQEVLTYLFKVIELGLFESSNIYNYSVIEKGKLIFLPPHLYDTNNYKNYWLRICMLLTVLEEQAMDSLLLGPDKQNKFVQSIMSVMEKPADDQSKDPFWPALHCFMVILDKLGSKVWGQPIDPVEAFQNIINNPSYKNEIKSIRESCTRIKSEPMSNYGDDMSCSQIVYDYQTEKLQKDVSWKSTICPDYCPNLYEEMQTVADMLQHEVGQDMRLHNSTFLWFIPFVHSIMDLWEGVALNGEVIHHLCSEVRVVHSVGFPYFDKVSEFFMWILVSVVELHRNKNSLHLLWITSSKWVEAVVNCATLSSGAFLRGAEKSARSYPAALSQGCDSIQSACMKLIRSLLKEGYQLGQKVNCEPFLNRLNAIVRCGVSHKEGWPLTMQERQALQVCLKQVLRSIKDKWLQSAAPRENSRVCPTSPAHSIKQEKGRPKNRGLLTTCCTFQVNPPSTDRPADLRSSLTRDPDLQNSSEDDIPFTIILQKLRIKGAASAASPTMDSQAERDLSKLSVATCVTDFPVDSREESTASCESPIKRKIQFAPGSLRVNHQSQGDKPTNQAITISDSEEENGEPMKEKAGLCLEKQSGMFPERVQEQVLRPTSSSPLPDVECASQFFEFEIKEDIYSPWQDNREDEKMEKEPCPSVKTNSCGASADLEAIQQINEWGYDTDYLGDEVTEKAAEAFEQQVKYGNTERQQVQISKGSEGAKRRASMDKEPVGKGTVESPSDYDSGVHTKDRKRLKHKDLVQPHTSPFSDESPLGKHSLKSQQAKAAQSSKKRSLKPCGGHTKLLQDKLFSSDPAEAPPRNNHHQQSTAEKLGQKTSQNALERSPDTIAKSHNCEETADETRVPVKKAILIAAQNLVVRNRKLLACQEHQQSIVEKLGLKKAPRKALELSPRSLYNVAQLRNYGKAIGDLGLPQPKAQKQAGKNQKMLAYQGRPSRQLGSRLSDKDRRARKAANLAKKSQLKQSSELHTSRMVTEKQKVGAEQVTSSSNERNLLRQSLLEKEGFQLPPEPPWTRRDSAATIQGSCAAPPILPGTSFTSVTGGRKRDLSPSSPCDEGSDPKESMANLDENIEEDDGLTQRDAVDMELCSQEKNEIEMEVNVAQGPLQGHSLSCETGSHAGCLEKVSQAGVPCREHSAPDTSNHVFAKPSAPARPPTAKCFSSSSSRNANLTKELGNSSKGSVAENAFIPLASGFRSQTPTVSSILWPQNSNPVPLPWTMQSNCVAAAIRQRAAIPGANAGREVCQPNTHQRDFNMFVKEILKWDYNMFEDHNKIGAPGHLCQSIVGLVPLMFQDYDDYFDTFFPLMMINAFETVAQDWLETQKSKETSFSLSLVSYSADVGTAYFTVNIPESDLATQRHPKENDLVFLTMMKKQSPSGEEKENCGECHVGYVTQFKSGNPTKKNVICHLSIQTQGNLFRASKQVKCTVVSSLLTTQRGFKALLFLRRNPLYKPIISPSYGYFCPRRLNVDMKNTASDEFNEDQRRAIETAYAMVTQEPSVPSICLIHGPPGTGKSKTIIGLLDRILNDSSRTENPPQHSHTRRKQNRVLVCAPSNAAVDELMKKIILVFKEKCQDKEKCLGNCGDVNLVRLGQEKAINKDVRQFSLDELVEHRINRKKAGEDQGCPKGKIADLDQQLDMLSRQRALDRREDKEKRQHLEEEICRLSKRRQQLASQLKQVHRHSQELKSTIILESNIICCTLSTSGLPLLESTFRRQGSDPFSSIIVDEAGQSCEVETLIPLIHGCKKLILVGDPKQLPPTVKSKKAQDHGYDQSLMGRLCRHLEDQNWDDKLILQLKIQYRMHPDLCIFPSKYIYSRKLVTAKETESNQGSLEWLFLPYMFLDIYDGEEKPDSGSFINEREAWMVVELIKVIKTKINRADNIGIITPYNAQKWKITKDLETEFKADRIWEVDTVDGFQGREKSCIIMSCVRATRDPQGRSVGFLRSVQRLNVAITRAKYSLFILGHLETLKENIDWKALLDDAGKRGAITKASCRTSREELLKIILKTLSQSAMVIPERTLPRSAGTAGSHWNNTPQTLSMAEGSGLAQPSLVSLNSSSKKPPLPTQARPLRERLQDPLLAHIHKSGSLQRDHLPSSSLGSGVVLPQNFDACFGQSTPTLEHTHLCLQGRNYLQTCSMWATSACMSSSCAPHHWRHCL